MKERISTLGYDLAALTIIGLAAFAGQVTANYIPIFGRSPVVTRIVILEDRVDQLEKNLDKKIGF